MQIGKITNAHRELLIEELYLRGIVVDKKELITRMKVMLINNKHPNSKNDEEKKYFNPKFLTAADWSKDSLDVTLAKLRIIRSGRLMNDVADLQNFIVVVRLNRCCLC